MPVFADTTGNFLSSIFRAPDSHRVTVTRETSQQCRQLLLRKRWGLGFAKCLERMGDFHCHISTISVQDLAIALCSIGTGRGIVCELMYQYGYNDIRQATGPPVRR